MPRIKSKVQGNVDELAGKKAAGYAGPTPPKGVYKGTVRFLKLRGKKVGNKFVPQENKNGDHMIRGAVSIKETGSKARYNGYLINFNQNHSTQGAPFVNQMLDSMFNGSAEVRASFWKDFVGIDLEGNITHIGKTRYTDNSIEVVVSAKDAKPGPNGQKGLEVGAWLLRTSDEAEDAAEEDEDVDPDEDEDISFEDDDEDSDKYDNNADEDPDEDDPEDDDAEAEDDLDEDADDEDDDGEDDEDGTEDEDDEDSEEESEFDAEARLAELNAMSRDELKALLKEKNSDAKVLKSDTVETLAKKIVELEDGEAPF